MDQTKLEDLLVGVSRSFSLSLLFLPRPEREAVSVAYLIARYADTLTDSGRLPSATRLTYLEHWENSVFGRKCQWSFKESVGSFTPSEAELLLKGVDVIEAYQRLNAGYHFAIETVCRQLMKGMRWDLKTFSGEERQFGVTDDALFDWYCYTIAGCVGEFWVRIFGLPETVERLAVRYGQGLQRINILRDVTQDWKRGRVYLPKSELEKFNLRSDDALWTQASWPEFVMSYCQKTRSYFLHYGAQFCDTIPWKRMRLRWSSWMPLAIGLATLKKMEGCPPWEPPIKISRAEVKRLGLSLFIGTLFGRKAS